MRWIASDAVDNTRCITAGRPGGRPLQKGDDGATVGVGSRTVRGMHLRGVREAAPYERMFEGAPVGVGVPDDPEHEMICTARTIVPPYPVGSGHDATG